MLPSDVFRIWNFIGDFSGSCVDRFVVLSEGVRSTLKFDAVGHVDLKSNRPFGKIKIMFLSI